MESLSIVLLLSLFSILFSTFYFQYIILSVNESLNSKIFSIFEDVYGFKPKNAHSSSNLSSDSGNGNYINSLQTTAYHFIKSWGSEEGYGEGDFYNPEGIAVDSSSGVFDHRIIAKANNIPQDEVRNYLDQLKSRGLIREDIQPTGASFRLYMITAEGIQELEDQDQK